MIKPTSKIIQICPGGFDNMLVVCLCEDGSLWMKNTHYKDEEWFCVLEAQ